MKSPPSYLLPGLTGQTGSCVKSYSGAVRGPADGKQAGTLLIPLCETVNRAYLCIFVFVRVGVRDGDPSQPLRMQLDFPIAISCNMVMRFQLQDSTTKPFD